MIRSAHVEAKAAPNGVGLVRVMGRHSGFIACYATLATGDADFVLIPEVPFDLDGEHSFLGVLRRRLDESGHAVIVVAEGAGQDLLERVLPSPRSQYGSRGHERPNGDDGWTVAWTVRACADAPRGAGAVSGRSVWRLVDVGARSHWPARDDRVMSRRGWTELGCSCEES